MSDRIVVMGAGALTLGFLGPELSRDYHMTFVDTRAKSDFIAGMRAGRDYVFNLAAEEVRPTRVENVTALNLEDPHDAEVIRRHISEARIFFTAVGIRNLDKALFYLTERMQGRKDEIFILCAENGEDIARDWRNRVPSNIHICDTVMGRMCRLEEEPSAPYVRVLHPADSETPPERREVRWGIVAEDFYGIPVSTENYRPQLFHSKAFEIVSPEEFHAREQIKLFAHNGLHLFIALSAGRKGMTHFPEAGRDAQLMAEAHALLHEEIAPALWRRWGHIVKKAYFEAYMERLLPRLVSPTLNDAVARGVRGLADKFADNERVMGGLHLLLQTDVEPRIFLTFIARGLDALASSDPSAAERVAHRLPAHLLKKVQEQRA